jgi:hypothetical protein
MSGTDRELREQAVRLWATSSATLVQSAADCIKALQGNLKTYRDPPSDAGDVRDATRWLEAALTAVNNAHRFMQRIADTRWEEEQAR